MDGFERQFRAAPIATRLHCVCVCCHTPSAITTPPNRYLRTAPPPYSPQSSSVQPMVAVPAAQGSAVQARTRARWREVTTAAAEHRRAQAVLPIGCGPAPPQHWLGTAATRRLGSADAVDCPVVRPTRHGALQRTTGCGRLLCDTHPHKTSRNSVMGGGGGIVYRPRCTPQLHPCTSCK